MLTHVLSLLSTMPMCLRPALFILVALAAVAFWPQHEHASAAGAPDLGLGRSHTCAVTGAGGVQCWGLNLSGQLGNDTEGSSDPNPLPVDVLETPGGAPLAGAISVSAGISHTCALMETTGGVRCWGNNSLGQIGDDQSCGIACATPIDVTGLASGVSSVSAGGSHACAVTDSGDVKCWGFNHVGQLGSDTQQTCSVVSLPCSTTPLDVAGLTSGAVTVATGLEHSCAVTDTGGIDCWGKNHLGQLGDGTTNTRVGPVSVCNVYDGGSQSCTELLSGAVAVSLGTFHTCALVEAEPPATGHGVKCWGAGALGQLGGGVCCSPSSTPIDVAGLTSGASIMNVGEDHTCAVNEAGGVECWGLNDEGQLGAASAEFCNIILPCSSSPVSVSGLESRALALDVGGAHTCAATEGESVQCWGLNDAGQLGDGTTEQRFAPVGVVIDSDSDGCTDAQELQATAGSEVDGGRRNPKSFWDFFDVPTGQPFERNRSVDIGDIGAVVAHFGATRDPAPTKEEALAEALTTPIDLTTYHPAYDRTALGPNPWNPGPPNGEVSIQDIALVVAQFGHSCIVS